MSNDQLFAALGRHTSPGRRLGLIALAVLLFAGVYAFATVMPLLSAWSAKSDLAVAGTGDREAQARKARFDTILAQSADAIDKRWPFAAERIIVEVAPPPRTPTVYRGPALVGMVGDTAIFADGRMRTVGSEAVEGVAVVSLDPPWSAKVRWSGAEFTVSLFEKHQNLLVAGPDLLKPGQGGFAGSSDGTGSGRSGSGSPMSSPGNSGGGGGAPGAALAPGMVTRTGPNGGRPGGGGPGGGGPGGGGTNGTAGNPGNAMPGTVAGSQGVQPATSSTFSTFTPPVEERVIVQPDGSVVRIVTAGGPVPATGTPTAIPLPPPPPEPDPKQQ